MRTRLFSSSALACFIGFTLLVVPAAAAPSAARTDGDNTPANLSSALDLGPADAESPIRITIHLKPRDPELFRAAVDARYNPASPLFHAWMTASDLARFAPPAAQLQAVCSELASQGLTVTSVAENGFSLRATGGLGNVARAFNTQIHNFKRGGDTFRANISNARLSGDAGVYVNSVAGLQSHTVRPLLARAINTSTHKPYAPVALRDVAAAGGLEKIITDQSLSGKRSFTYSSPGQALPTATYAGIVYDADASLVPDFTARQLQNIYGLADAYKQGLDGTGQTIVLLEAFGYPQIEDDANAFSKLSGLPPLTSKNFSIVYPEGKPALPNEGALTGWSGEIALDVQWAHAIAPGAKILVVATNGQDSEDFQASMQYIVDNNLAAVVSDSWEEDTDIVAGPFEQESFEDILTEAAAKGISFQFSTGDQGDVGVGSPIGAPGVPSVAPHATAVGGTTILNKVGGKGFVQVGWGNAEAYLDVYFGPLDPPFSFSVYGAGGGESVFWPKPAWQIALPGTGRQTPDVSALADPFTGVPVVLTSGGQQAVELGVGGTSLASPIFTAIWAIAIQKAGHNLGQAAPTIAVLATTAGSGIKDVVPITSLDNVAGSVTDTNGTEHYSANRLYNNYVKGFKSKSTMFTAAIWDQPNYNDSLSLAFGLDTSLRVTNGWDNVTGYGTPYGLSFINAAAAFGGR